MRPHVEAQGCQENRGDVPRVAQVRGGAGHGQVRGPGMGQRGEHVADTPEVDIGHTDADGERGEHHQRIFQDADPGDGAHATGQNE